MHSEKNIPPPVNPAPPGHMNFVHSLIFEWNEKNQLEIELLVSDHV